MKTQKKTIKDLEAELGVTDTIRNPNGQNARSDQNITTLQKKLLRLLPGLTLPETPVTAILIQFADGSKVSVNPIDLDKASTVLHALGLV
jgi:hypothetical protein